MSRIGCRCTHHFGAGLVSSFVLLVSLAGPVRAVTFQGFTVTARGAATLTVFGSDSLVVGNIGSSGNDGYRISLPPDTTGDLAVISRPPSIGATPTGAFMAFTALGTVNGVPNSEIMRRRAENTGVGADPIAYTEDFSPVGVTKLHFETINAAGVVKCHDSSPGDSSTLRFFSQKWVEGVTTLYVDGMNMGSDWSDGGWFDAQFTDRRDELVLAGHISPEKGVDTHTTALTSFDMRGKDLGSLTLTAIRIDPAWSQAVPIASLPMMAIVMVALFAVGCVVLWRRRRALA